MFGSINRSVLAAAAVAIGSSAVQAAVVTSALPTGAAFEGTPTVTTAPIGNISTNFTSSEPVGPTNTSGHVLLGQTFTTGATGFTLDKLEFFATGGNQTGHTINLYLVASGGTGATQTVVPTVPGLLGVGGAGLTFNYVGTGTGGYEVLDFTGTDEIPLLPNTVYYAEIGGASASGDINLLRAGGGASTYAGGNLYYGTAATTTTRGSVFNGDVRDGAFAIYATVPEPASLGLLGVAAVGLIRRRRV